MRLTCTGPTHLHRWWDVPVTSQSRLESTQKAYAEYTGQVAAQRRFFLTASPISGWGLGDVS
ncbi:epi-inositol hydrolase [Cutibacterium acnes JCM 18909]|nr:epi-inositol hydrolase [Cutibacterium acnes JCM 18909]